MKQVEGALLLQFERQLPLACDKKRNVKCELNRINSFFYANVHQWSQLDRQQVRLTVILC